jgi:DNA modification methylase
MLDGKVRLLPGDCREVMATLPDASVDAIVCDPPYGLAFMGRAWDAPDGAPFAVELWAQALRVLKPGGHVVAFSGTRTYHRLACAIEDAGFEIRDQLAWVYGSGFPKSMDVAKQLDKVAGVKGEFGAPKSAAHADMLARGVARRGEKHEGWDRPWMDDPEAVSNAQRQYIPSTDAARQWQGWGTALKPSWEPICLARKPLSSLETNVLAVVESQLREHGVRGEIRWKRGSASDAGKQKNPPHSSSIELPEAAGTSASLAETSARSRTERSTPRTTADGGANGQKTIATGLGSIPEKLTQSSAPMFSAHTGEDASVAGNRKNVSSPSTTSTAAEQSTGKPSTARSTPNSVERDTRPAIASFAGIATGLTGSLAHVLINQSEDGMFVWPDGLPEFVPAKALTVAANVLAHGTGALNIDGTRVGTADTYTYPNGRGGSPIHKGGQDCSAPAESNPLGRWPANLLHDGSEEVVALFPESGDNWRADKGAGLGYHGADAARGAAGHTDSGSAARFFYTSKADAEDRLGSTHPTVKPVDLMQWLCRLVCPKGGVVLDPFAGTGTTGEAAWREGMRAILIEREPEYQQDIARRMDLATQPTKRAAVAATKNKLDDPNTLPLFAGAAE